MSISDQRRAGMVAAVVALLSSVVYFAWSESVRAALRILTSDYTRFLLGEFAAGRHRAVVAALHIDAHGLIDLVVLAILSTVVALLLRRAIGSSAHDIGPELIVYGSAAVVVPPQLIAIAFWPDGRGHLTSRNLLVVTGAAVVMLAPFALRRRRPRATTERTPFDGWPALFLTATLIFAVLCAVHALSTIRGMDSYTYHLPRVASWLHHGSLTTNVDESIFFFFPGDAELFVRWFVAAGDRIAFAFSFGASMLALYVLYKICREAGQPADVAAVASLCASSCVVLSFVSVGVYVDSFLALQLMLAVLFLLRWANDENSGLRTIVPMSLALGIALGTKYAAIPAIVVIGGIWLWRVGRREVNRYGGCLEIVNWPAMLRAAIVPAIVVMIPSLYWYARNLVEHRNPLFPAAVLGMNGMPLRTMIATAPVLANKAEWLVFPWHEAGYLAMEDALGGVFAGIALVGLVIAPWQFKKRRVAMLWITTAASLAMWLLTGNVVLRYGLFAILLTYAFVGELWIAYGSVALRLITFGVFVATIALFGSEYTVQTIYTSIAGQPHYGVPDEINKIRPGRVFNATSHDANYGCMGSDYRHDLICVYFNPKPDDLKRHRPDYVLLRDSDVAAYNQTAVLEKIAESEHDASGTSLWRVVALRP